jgi:hypothetical protein
MKLNDVLETLHYAHLASQAVFIWGKPGLGKTEIVKQYAFQKKMPLIKFMAPTTDLIHLTGALTIDEKTAQFIPLAIWPKPSDILLIDEFPQAPQSLQNGFSSLLLDQELDNIKLPKGSLVVATGNRQEDRCATNKVPEHIINRALHIEADTSSEEWLIWASKTQIDTRIIGFGHFRPELLNNFIPQMGGKPYATYRSWHMLSNVLDKGLPEKLLYETTKGLVGEAAAIEFCAFVKLMGNLPDPKAVLANPANFEPPSDLGQLYAITSALASYVNDKKSAETLFVIEKKLPREFGVLLIKQTHSRYSLKTLKVFQAWCVENAGLII